jgi:addiction module RelE/StbE family toxin
MTLRWTPTAISDLESLHAYIHADKPSAATRIAARIVSAANALTRQPLMGRPGRSDGTREMVVRPFVIVYRALPDAVCAFGEPA